jgi:putative toxin-antitoxin system antitoxin component (TIGR02293 family)
MLQSFEILTKEKVDPKTTEMEMIRKIRRGLPPKAILNLSSELHVSKKELCEKILRLSIRTIARRVALLEADETDKLYRAARVLALARMVLESNQNALIWLTTPNKALEGEIPLYLLDTEIGAREVEDLLNRIEFSVYA